MKSHWTTRYIFDRIREWTFHRTHPQAPWLGPQAVKLLDELLEPYFNGLEAGAGRSTVWIAMRVRQLVALEEEEGWLIRVRKRVAQAGLHNVTLQRISGSGDELTNNYRHALSSVPHESLHFATVDSENERDNIALALLPKIKPGGFLMLDNANWFLPSPSRSPVSRRIAEGALNDNWARFAEATKSWRCLWTSSGVTDTAFYFKPSD